MINKIQLTLTPQEAASEQQIKTAASRRLNIAEQDITQINIIKKSIDSRSRNPVIHLQADIYIGETPKYQYTNTFQYKNVEHAQPVIIVGAGPAGLFAALRLIEHGIKPIILERGKQVAERKIDIAQLNRNHRLDNESNYCFGEGGAGTFSDGKLYTRSNKRGNIRRILEIFHAHGAQDQILYEAHPHIGTDRLPTVIKNIRQHIISCGGEIHFNSRVSEIIHHNRQAQGVKCADGTTHHARHIILATGHSARDIYQTLHHQNITIQPKGFAIGVRVEHPQTLIDSIQYHTRTRNQYLPPATYSLVHQVENRGVYSFCMCPGGHIVPSATEPNQIVVNGMSASHRNSPYANSGIIVELHPQDLTTDPTDPLAGLRFQQQIEQLAFNNNGGTFQKAPAQRLDDFVHRRLSYDLPPCSYLPGVISSPLHFWLPDIISRRLQQGFKAFDRKMHGYLTNQAIVVGVESRSSSPIRIPRHPDTLQHPDIQGLYPAGEGSGYAGGITSSAMDGENCADQIALNINNKI